MEQQQTKPRTLRQLREDVYCESQKEFATRLGTHPVAVHYWEHGQRSPAMPTRRKIAAALGLAPTDIVWPPTKDRKRKGNGKAEAKGNGNGKAPTRSQPQARRHQPS